MHVQVRSFADGRDAILGRVEMQINTTIDVISKSIHICERSGPMCANRKAICGVTKGIEEIFDWTRNLMIFPHILFPRTDLCTRVNNWHRNWADIGHIIWDFGCYIINWYLHGFELKSGFGMAQTINKSLIVVLQYNPRRINVESSKEMTRIFTGEVNRRTGHGTMILVDHADH